MQLVKDLLQLLDKDNLPISDASAALIGTTVGTLTDEDGRFSLDVKSDTAILSISMLGYTEERFKITKMSGYLRIRLQEDDIVLSDVTVEAQRKQSDNVVLIDVSNMRNVPTVTGGVVKLYVAKTEITLYFVFTEGQLKVVKSSVAYFPEMNFVKLYFARDC